MVVLQVKVFGTIKIHLMKKFALIVAGGSGSRMGSQQLKQFMEIAGKPVLMHTIEAFTTFDPAIMIILVLPENQKKFWEELCNKHKFQIPHSVANGGFLRFHSVKNGLDAIPEEDGIVFIHDSVRPLVSHETLQRCYDGAVKYGNAIPVFSVSESIRVKDAGISYPVDRSKLVLVQTPQTFRLPLIKSAYQQEYCPEFTDDATVLEKTVKSIHLVEGNRENIKITWPEDLIFAGMVFEIKTFRTNL
jgi:2-C-methyl-D-erythritol 4-phosphate cytidylyltransferase